jgi:hypothetical protein
VCSGCHTEIAASQVKTSHASALRPANDDRVKAEWAFGSGVQAITYVSQIDEDHYLEHPLSWYAKANGLGPTPGHEKLPDGMRYRTFAPDAAILRCFQCHSTGKPKLAAGRKIEPAELGVRCESCHGAGVEHAGAPQPRNIRNPGRLTSIEINEVCGACHRMPPAAGVETNWDNPWNTRHQPVYLSQSACFLKSEGRLSCLTCHNPHSDAKVDVSRRCSGCHEKPRHQSAVGQQACAGCHMPEVRPNQWLGFRNHWIGVYAMPLTQKGSLMPVTSRPSGSR